MLVYFDTSAFIKMVHEEEFSFDVRKYFDFLSPNDIPIIPVERSDFDIAGIIEPQNRNLRSLDALHLAVAKATDSSLFVTYDVRQIAAAVSLGLTVVSPGKP